jgi:hypothetical protein
LLALSQEYPFLYNKTAIHLTKFAQVSQDID